MAAPNDSWRFAIDDDTTGWQYPAGRERDGVYAFKRRAAGHLRHLHDVDHGHDGINIKEFELLVGNEAPLGAFDSIGRFQTQNIRLYPSPWQEFKFQPVRARFLKLHVISAWDPAWKTQGGNEFCNAEGHGVAASQPLLRARHRSNLGPDHERDAPVVSAVRRHPRAAARR